MEELRPKKNISKTEKEEIAREMVKGYEKMAAVNEDLIRNFFLIKDGTN